MNIYKIEKQISKYIETMSNRFQILNTLTKSLLNEKYKYSTLKYFHDILGIE